MKKTAKRILLLCCAVMVIFAFGGCGTDMSDSPYLGTWTAVSAEYTGIAMEVSEVVDGDFSFTLNDNGYYDAVIGEDTGTGSWSESENGVLLEGLEDDPVEAVINGDTMTFVSDDVTFTLQR